MRRSSSSLLAWLGVAAMAVVACGDEDVGGAPVDAGDAPALPSTETRDLPRCEWAEVVGTSDGDTIRVEIDGERERVRYVGIDAPELRPEDGPPEPLAQESADANASLVAGRRVCLERDVSDTDQYGRLLRYVWLPDGRMVNEVLVAGGLAEARRYRPDVRHHEEILAPAQVDAMRARRGMWR